MLCTAYKPLHHCHCDDDEDVLHVHLPQGNSVLLQQLYLNMLCSIGFGYIPSPAERALPGITNEISTVISCVIPQKCTTLHTFKASHVVSLQQRIVVTLI